MILLIDNYDSFVFNLARYVRELHFKTMVRRNNEISYAEIENLNPTHIIISPGPGKPIDAGISMGVIQYFGSRIPILGVCLGHQAIGQVYGGDVLRAQYPMHGKASAIIHNGDNLFSGLPNPLLAARYHSLIISETNFPKELMITARSDQNEIMAVEHRHFPVVGVQFHPESILTQSGYALLENFLKPKFTCAC